jgi:CHASE2 domain-containing sensor protein
LFIVLFGATLIFFSGFKQLDDLTLSLKYYARGENQTDSTIILLYLDNNDIAALGGWPLRRNYYALLVKVLDELGAKAIGIDIGLIEPNTMQPEQDDVLSSIINNSKNVILACSFRTVKEGEPNLSSRPPENTGYKISHKMEFLSGENLSVPDSNFFSVSAGIGHENLS